MRVITDPAHINHTLRNLCVSVQQDVYSWQSWHVLIISTDPPITGMHLGHIVAETRALLQEHDGMLLWLENGFCIGILHSPNPLDASALNLSLSKELPTISSLIQVQTYSIAAQSDEVISLLKIFYNDRETVDNKSDRAVPDLSSSVSRLDDLIPLWEKTRVTGQERQRPHILIVDDDGLTRCIINQSLSKDYAILTAETVAEAVRKHILFAPNIIFLDIDLPDHDGLTFLRHLRHYDNDCKVIMFSSNTYLDNRLTAFACGASGFIAKPFKRKTFEHYINAWNVQHDQTGVEGRL